LYVAGKGARASLPALTDELLNKVKQVRSEVFAKWSAREPGETLELLFHRDVTRRPAR
jgi:hypothetical protein